MTKCLVAILLVSNLCYAQNLEVDVKSNYNQAFTLLEGMLNGRKQINFKRAVIATEKAYLDNQLDTTAFNDAINALTSRCAEFFLSNPLIYDKKDIETVSKWGSIFKIMTDTIVKPLGSLVVAHLPFRYDFEDFFGDRDWTKMFVSKLLHTNSGNCHSLPYLYKILAEEMRTTAHLALAPNHIYIKHWSIKTGWYNTELTSGAFPIDAWIMASGYVHLEAIQNAIYMKALSDQESIALCLIDLAEGYKRKTKSSDPEFILKCCNTALKYFPNYINALILKAETLKFNYDNFVKNNNVDDKTRQRANEMFTEMQNLYVSIHDLGYRQMPRDMYFRWLVELKTEREKYENKNVSSFTK